MSDILYNPPAIKKAKDIRLTIQDSQKFSFRPRDIFFQDSDLFVVGDEDIAIKRGWGKREYHFDDLVGGGLFKVSLHSSLSGLAACFYQAGGGGYLFFQDRMYDISSSNLQALFLLGDEIYRFLSKEGEIVIQRTPLPEEPEKASLNWSWRKEDLGSYDKVLVEKSEALLFRYAKDPLPGTYLKHLSKEGKFSEEIYLPTRIGHFTYHVDGEDIYFVERGHLYRFSLEGFDRKESLDLGSSNIKKMAFEKEKMIFLDYNNFLHFFYRGKKIGRSKLPGNFYGLALYGGKIYMADRNDNSIKTMTY